MRRWAAAVALLLQVGAAHAADDVLGWHPTVWGMTPAEVRRALAAEGLPVVAAPAGPAALKSRAQMLGRDWDVLLSFADEPRRLDRVLLQALGVSRPEALALHGDLVRTFTETYGPAADTVARGTTASMTRWKLKSTVIALSMYTDTYARARYTTQVSIMYAPAFGPDPQQKSVALGLLRWLGEGWPR